MTKEQLIKEAAKKYAGVNWGDVGTKVLGTLGAVGIIYGLTEAVETIVEYLKDRRTKVKSKEYYRKMLEAHPELQKQDLKKVALYWESLNHFSPIVAQDPLASGAYISQSLQRQYEFGGPPPDTISTLTQIQKSRYEAGLKPEMSLTPELKKALLLEAARITIKDIHDAA